MTKTEMVALLKIEVKGLTSYLVDADYNAAVDDSERETWTFPVSTSFRVYWAKERAKRHLFFYLLSESAHKFKIKQISLNQRFEHYRDIIQYMDEQFLFAQENNPQEFAGTDAYTLFGTRVNAGFRYDGVGDDITYKDTNLVTFSPNDSD